MTSLLLCRAYLNVEYAILVLKLTYNINNNYNDEIQSPAKPKKRNLKDAIEIKSFETHRNIHVIRRLKYILRYLNFQDKKLLLKELRLNRDITKG